MVSEAEKFSEEDKKKRDDVDARNQVSFLGLTDHTSLVSLMFSGLGTDNLPVLYQVAATGNTYKSCGSREHISIQPIWLVTKAKLLPHR